jgi:hypothetical protein
MNIAELAPMLAAVDILPGMVVTSDDWKMYPNTWSFLVISSEANEKAPKDRILTLLTQEEGHRIFRFSFFHATSFYVLYGWDDDFV